MASKMSVKEVMVECAESSSLHGLPKISSSKQIAVKTLWCMLVLGALGLCAYQVYQLIETYYKYPVQTSVTLHNSQIQFPAVTLCNMNPFRLSKSTDELNEVLFGTTAAVAEVTNGAFNLLFGLLYDDNAKEAVTLADEPKEDSYYVWHHKVMAQFRQLPIETRKLMGHRIEDMLHSAKFAGYLYGPEVFNLSLSPEYGNCYTLDMRSLIVKRTGPRNGLRLVLNLENSEYLSHLSSGSGFRIVIHEPNTMPNPEEDGITLNPGYETSISMKMIQLKRLGKPYGLCSDRNTDEGFIMTVQYCTQLCNARYAVKVCGCISYSTQDIFETNAEICTTEEEIECIRDLDDANCNCESRCKEREFTTVISGRQWPNRHFLDKVLMKEACSRNISSMEIVCAVLSLEGNITESTYHYYASNFLAVNIYYEQLNYQVLEERPLFDPVSLLSSIGGTMGFYLGASVLTYFEVLHFLLELILLCINGRNRHHKAVIAPSKA